MGPARAVAWLRPCLQVDQISAAPSRGGPARADPGRRDAQPKGDDLDDRQQRPASFRDEYGEEIMPSRAKFYESQQREQAAQRLVEDVWAYAAKRALESCNPTQIGRSPTERGARGPRDLRMNVPLLQVTWTFVRVVFSRRASCSSAALQPPQRSSSE
eukprot:7388906-Prymnesium_polylepis.2